MSRVLGFAILLALGASAVHADEDGTAYSLNQAKLTEQLNAQIAKRVALDAPAPPAKQMPAVEGSSLAKSDRARS